MSRRPIWGVSAWGGFVCLLLAYSSLVRGAFASGGVMTLGAVALFAWALWLEHSRR
jgi:hypothetical protein